MSLTITQRKWKCDIVKPSSWDIWSILEEDLLVKTHSRNSCLKALVFIFFLHVTERLRAVHFFTFSAGNGGALCTVGLEVRPS